MPTTAGPRAPQKGTEMKELRALIVPLLPGIEKYKPNYTLMAEWASFYNWIWENHPITEDIE